MNNYKTPLRVEGILTPSGTQDVNIISPIPIPVTVTVEIATTSVVTRVPSSTSSQILVLANPARLGLALFNDSTTDQYVKFGLTASNTDFTIKLTRGSYYEVPPPIYVGRIDVISSSTNGAIQVTELS